MEDSIVASECYSNIIKPNEDRRGQLLGFEGQRTIDELGCKANRRWIEVSSVRVEDN